MICLGMVYYYFDTFVKCHCFIFISKGIYKIQKANSKLV